MKYKAEDYVFQFNNPQIRKNIENSTREKIFQYTNLDALISILRNRTLKFNRIDNVNDQSEKLFINDQEIINQVFLCCFTYRISEYIPHWFMYSKDVYGIRLAIYKKKDSLTTECLIDYKKAITAYRNGEKIDELGALNQITDFVPSNKQWHVDFKSIDVIYDNEFALNNPIIRDNSDGSKMIDLSALGTTKSDAWKFENESRMVAQLRTLYDDAIVNEYDYLLVPIHFKNIEKIKITCGPWMTDTLKSAVKDICTTYLDGINYEVNSSKFDKIIRR